MSLKYSKFGKNNDIDNNIHLKREEVKSSRTYINRSFGVTKEANKFNNNLSLNLTREPTRQLINRKVKTVKKQIPKIDEKFICKYDPNDKHLYKNNARILPCNNITCTDCVKKFVDTNTGILKCNFCGNEHRIVSIANLQIDPNLVISMDKNKALIGEDLLQQLRFYLDQLISKRPFKLNNFSNIFFLL